MKLFKNLGILFMSLALAWGCASKEEAPKEVIRPVVYQEVAPGGKVQGRTFSGTAKSGTETKLSFKVSGNIQVLNVKVGQEVRKNALIASLDASDLQLQYEQADAAVKNADASEKQTKSAFERARTLYENGSTSLSAYESAKAAYESAKANESSLKQARKLARAQLGYTRLYAPVEGKVSTVNAEINENVSAGQQIVMLSSKGDLEVEIGVPESFIASVNVQDEVEITFSALSGKTFRGTVSEVGFSISPQTATYPVVVKVADANQVRPGMAASVTFTTRTVSEEAEEASLLVPAQAVGEDENGNFVFLLESQEGHYLARKQPVAIGNLTANGFEVTDGLEEGDLIATAGLQTLLDSMKVSLYEGRN